MSKPCVRCQQPLGKHPSGKPYCLAYVKPAPLWLRVLNKVLS